MNNNDGILLKCSCCNREVMAGANIASGHLEIADGRHGTVHVLDMPLKVLVHLLDPRGTSFVAIGSAK